MNKNWKIFLAIIFGFHLLLLLKLKFTAWPEMLAWPYLMINGWLPYKDIAVAHTPLMLVDLFVFFKIFGVGIPQLKIFTWILILGLDILVFWMARKFWGIRVALLSLIAYVLLQVVYQGNGLWFDLYMTFFALLSFYFLIGKKYFWTGMFWTLAFFSKQTAFWFLIPMGIAFLIDNVRRPLKVGKFALGVLAVILPFIAILYFLGILPDFYKWAIEFGVGVLPRALGQVQLPSAKQLLIYLSPFLVLVPLLLKNDKKNMPVILFAVFGMMGVYPRWELFHFQPALPFLAIAGGLIFSTFSKNRPSTFVFFIPFVFVMILFTKTLYGDWGSSVRFYEKDVQDIASYIEQKTKSGEKILVLNYWDNLYPLTNTLPAERPWVPQLSWYMERADIQEQMIAGMEKNKPVVIILNPYSQVGLASYRPQKVLEWVNSNYKISENVSGLEVWLPK